MAYLFLLSRILVGGYFLMNAYNHLKNSSALAGYAASKGVPKPKAGVIFTGILLLIGGLGILLGAYIDIAVICITLFLIPTTFMMHAYWKISDPMMRMAERVNFYKNLGLLGATLAYLFIPEPWLLSIM